ncbi:MAG: agmatinase [Pseudomonadota bacterium]
MAGTLEYLSAEDGFLEPDRPDAAAPEMARAVVVPFGLEASVSYGGGTRDGPGAILAASDQLELYDEELKFCPCDAFGIATHVPVAPAETQAASLDRIADVVTDISDASRFPLLIGGEHALTAGAVRPLVGRDKPLTILQIDAHADLRDGYLGEPYSHASAMRRALDLDGISVVSVGIRAVSQAEVAFYEVNRDRVSIHWAHEQTRWDLEAMLAPIAGQRLYISFDIDGLDSGIMPATGTPTPGGLGFWQAMEICRRATEVAAETVGADVVELAPIPGLHACDYTAALIAHKLIAYALVNSPDRRESATL